MKVLFVEGGDLEVLRQLGRRYPYPYRLLVRPEEGVYLLEAWGVGADLVEEATRTEGVRAWAFDLLEEQRSWGE